MSDLRTPLDGYQLWPVESAYAVEGGILVASGTVERHYSPLQVRELATEFQKIDGEPAALAFVREWGLLGHWALVPPDQRRGGDPLDFVLGHARTVGKVLILWRAVEHGADDLIDAALVAAMCRPDDPMRVPKRSRRQQLSDPRKDPRVWRWTPPGSRETTPAFSYWSQANPRITTPYYFPEDATRDGRDVALELIGRVLNDNLAGASFAVRRGPKLDWPLLATLRWRALIDAIYWHLAVAVIARTRLATCRECGHLFLQASAQQEFCPSPATREEAVGLYIRQGHGRRTPSRCAGRYRQRKLKRSKQARKGGTP